MKLLAFGDLHIGAGYEHRQDALADTAAILDQIAALASERRADLILNAGDTFHRSKPTPAELHVFKRFCEALAALGIPMVAIGGNGMHDAPAGQRSALELFAGRWVEVSRVPEVVPIAGATVCTLPAASLSKLAAAQGGRQALEEQAAELLLRAARDLFASADTGAPRILLAHQMVSGASLPTGLSVEQVGSVVLPLEELEAIGFDAIVLGDLHAPQVLGEDQRAMYCGSPMCHDFGEADVEHGVYVLEFGDDVFEGYEYEFVPLADRRFATVDHDLTQDSSGERAASHAEGEGPTLAYTSEGGPDAQAEGMGARTLWPEDSRAEVSRLASGENAETSQDPIGLSPASPALDPTDALAAAIAASFPLTDTVARVRYRASEEQHRRVDHQALERLIADAGAHKLYGGIQWEPVREQQARAEGLDESLGPQDALALWLEAQSLNGAQGAALQALLGEWLEAEA